ncbi:hypothetical protein WL16_17040 [Burkholderia ubonensis]|nr:hypothetical protein WL16_17040 [Burkholderia ubonensis]
MNTVVNDRLQIGIEVIERGAINVPVDLITIRFPRVFACLHFRIAPFAEPEFNALILLNVAHESNQIINSTNSLANSEAGEQLRIRY